MPVNNRFSPNGFHKSRSEIFISEEAGRRKDFGSDRGEGDNQCVNQAKRRRQPNIAKIGVVVAVEVLLSAKAAGDYQCSITAKHIVRSNFRFCPRHFVFFRRFEVKSRQPVVCT